MHAALQSTLDVLHHDIEEKQLKATIQCAMQSPLPCYPAKIKQVLHSVLLNAVQASERGSTIELGAEADEEGVLVKGRDNGSGIDRRTSRGSSSRFSRPNRLAAARD